MRKNAPRILLNRYIDCPIIVLYFQVKILIHQRKQIPEQIDVLKRLSSTFEHRQASHHDENVTCNGDAKSRRDEIRVKRAEMRRAKLEKRFVEKASKSVEIFQRLIKNFFDEIVDQTSGQVEEVAIVFGATPVRIFQSFVHLNL